jgi:ATP-dependent Lon protease
MTGANEKNVSVVKASEAGGFYGAVNVDFEQLMLAMSDDGKAKHESPTPMEWTTDEFKELCKKRKLARQYARKAEESLLYDELSCPSCGSTRILSVPSGSIWRLSCKACGQAVDSAELKKALLQIENFSAYEAQFLKANPPETEAPTTSAPMVTIERALKDRATEDLRSDWRMVEVFPEKQLSAILEVSSIQSGDADEKSRIRQTMKRLIESSGFRPLAVPGPAWQAEIEELQENFPNFARAISDVVLPSLAIAAAGGRARPAPLLLVGSPGVGKSFFAEMLGKMLGVPRVKIDMASATIGACLSGLSSHWSNSGPGEVFKSLAFGRAGVEAVANPLLFLDEVDKVGKDMRYDPMGPLHSLLEIESARRYEDESLQGLVFDASHIRWIMCANETSPIPGPILSRVHVVNVREPTEIELIHIRARIFSGVVKSIGIPDFEDYLPSSVRHGTESQGPREFKTLAVMAIGKALARGKYRVSENDFSSGLSKPVRKLGFM